MSDVVRLRVGGVVFEAEKSILLRRFGNTFFHGLFSSGAWQPEADGTYFIDRPATGFDRILEYLSSGELSVDGLSDVEEECVYSSLDYFLIPYRRQWRYSAEIVIEGFSAGIVCKLKDGRLCGTYENNFVVWNMNRNAIDMTLNLHVEHNDRMFQLHDGRLCIYSNIGTINLWNIDSGVCELTLTGHHTSIVQLFDGRLCSGSWDKTVRVWNVSTGVCEMTLIIQFPVNCIAQLADCRVCCCSFSGDHDGTISIYSLLTGECELSWKAYTYPVQAIVCIGATRICSISYDYDRVMKVWSTASGKCVRTLKGHTARVTSMVLMQDGRLCSVSYDGCIKLWCLETGECERTLSQMSNLRSFHNVMQRIVAMLKTKHDYVQVLQLEDGRLLCACSRGTVVVWS